MKKYYYLDGLNRKGPYSEEDLIAFNLDSDTLIWTEGLENWTPLKNVTNLLKVMPPPIPDKDITLQINETTVIPPISKKVLGEKTMKTTYSVLILIILICVSILVSHLLISSKKNTLYKEILSEMEDRLHGYSNFTKACGSEYSGISQYGEPLTRRGIIMLDEMRGQAADFIYFLRKRHENKLNYYSSSTTIFEFSSITKIDRGFVIEKWSCFSIYITDDYEGTLEQACRTIYDKTYNDEFKECYYEKLHPLIIGTKYIEPNEYYSIKEIRTGIPTVDEVYNFNKYICANFIRNHNYFEIITDNFNINKDYKKFISIGCAASVLIFIILLIIKPF